MKDIEQVSGDVVDVALRLHKQLGPGLLESVYEVLLAAKLSEMGYRSSASSLSTSSLTVCGSTRHSAPIWSSMVD